MATKKKVVKEEYICQKCGLLFFEDSFIKTKSPMYKNGTIPICKECINYYIKDKNVLGGSIEMAIYYLCAITDTPLIGEVLDSCKEKDFKVVVRKKNYFELYMNKLEKMREDNKWYEFSDSNIGLEDIKGTNVVEATIKQKEKNMELIWGKKSIEDYSFLEYRYDMWIEEIDDLTVAQDKLYKDLCLAELRQRELEASNSSTKEIQAQILTLMNKLKRDKFENSKDKSVIEKMLETKIAIMELEDPAEYYEDKKMYMDYSGIGNYWLNHVIRPIKNVLLNQKEYNIRPDKENGE